LEALRSSKTDLFNNISPSKDHWISAGSGVSNCPYNLIFGHNIIRVELQITLGTKVANKYIFYQLFAEKDKIEGTFGHKLSWDRLDDRISSYVRYGLAVDGDNREDWPEMIAWLITHIIKMEAAFKKPLAEAAQAFKKAGIGSDATVSE